MKKQIFSSMINGAKIDVVDPLTADLLSKNEKKEIIQQERHTANKKSSKNTKVDKTDNEQEIS